MRMEFEREVEVSAAGRTFRVEVTKKFVDMARKHHGLPEGSEVTDQHVKEFLVGSLGNALKELEDGEG